MTRRCNLASRDAASARDDLVDRPARPRVGLRAARARVGQRGVPRAGAARAVLPRRRAARRRLGGRGPRAAARRRRAAAQLPRPTRARSTWRSGAAPRGGCSRSRRYAALLVSLHGTSLYERVDPDAYPPDVAAAIRAYLAGERALQAALSAGLDAAEVDRNRRLLLALDRFSLALCHGRATTLEELGAPIAVAPAAGGRRAAGRRATTTRCRRGRRPTRWTVAPWPFAAERVVVGCEARRLAGAFADARRCAGGARGGAVGAAALGAQPQVDADARRACRASSAGRRRTSRW